VAVVVAAGAGRLPPALTALTVPGAASLLLLIYLRARSRTGDQPAVPGRAAAARPGGGPMPPRFWWFATAGGLCSAGLVTYGLIGFHLVHAHLVTGAAVPLLYAAAMAAGAVAALVTGVAYDRCGPWTLVVLPVLVAAVPALAFGTGRTAVVAGILLWGAAVGVQDSTVKALVADLVPRHRRATAYGLFAAVQGVGALTGGVAVGALYQHSTTTLVVVVVTSQAVALLVLVVTFATTRGRASPSG
jgi:MFS family permease